MNSKPKNISAAFTTVLHTDNPRMGRVFDKRRRRYVYRSHHVYYRIQKDKILIVDIRNTRQNPL